MSFQILGTGSGLPACVRTNDDLAGFMDTSDEWIRTRTGIRERRVITTETLTDLAVAAAQAALDDAGVKPEELDYIICPTLCGDCVTPSLSCMVGERLGAVCPAVDMNAACSGFLYAMDLAAGLFERKRVKRVLMVPAEALTRLVDWNDRSTCVLFGDGAAAVVLGEGDSLMSLRLSSHGNWSALYAPGLTGNSPFTKEPIGETYLHMNGQEVYKFAVNAIATEITEALAEAGIAPEQVDHVLLHQANMRIIEAAQKKLSIPMDRYRCNIEHTGNTSAVSIPLLLDECRRDNLFKNGDILVMCGFGAGLTTGTAILRWDR